MASKDDLAAKIPDFPGYADAPARERSDELVRSYVGERVAEMAERLAPLSASLDERIGELLLRSAFADQAVHRQYDRGPADLDAVADADLKALEVADRSATIDAAHAGDYVASMSAALTARDAAMSNC